MNAIDLLKAQHRLIEELFTRIQKTKDAKKKETLFTDLADSLAVHTTIEEHHFYPGVKSRATEELLLESVEEHLAAKRVLSDLLDIPVDDETFNAKLKVLKDLVARHVEEEEGTLFPKVAKNVDKADLEEIAQAMLAEQGELEDKGNPREAVPMETEKAAPI